MNSKKAVKFPHLCDTPYTYNVHTPCVPCIPPCNCMNMITYSDPSPDKNLLIRLTMKACAATNGSHLLCQLIRWLYAHFTEFSDI